MTFGHRVIRKVSVDNGTISTIAGNGWGYSGDGGAAILAELNYPSGIALDTFGSIYIADEYNDRVRKLIGTCNTGI